MKSRWRDLLNAEIICALALLMLVAAVFYFSRDYPTMPGQFSGSPAFWPRVVAAVLGAMAVIMLVAGIVKPLRVTWPDRGNLAKLAVAIAVVYVSRWTLEWFGFVPSTTLLMLVCMLVLAEKKNLTFKPVLGMACVSLGLSYFLYFVLAHLASIPLPRGTWL